MSARSSRPAVRTRSSRRAAAGRALAAVVLSLVAAFLWWWQPTSPAHVSAPNTHTDVPSPTAPEPDREARDTLQTQPAVSPPSAAKSCAPHESVACYDGDVFWFDSCGQATDLIESCEDRGCDDASCTREESEPANACGQVSEYGTCIGDSAEVCVSGRIVRVDCASRHERCVMTTEGAACLPRDDKLACSGHELAACDGTRLRLCVDGRFRTLDCAARNGRCVTTGLAAHCEANPLEPALPPLLVPGELCDGKDNDGDAVVDEGAACDEVPLVAFIPQGAQLANLDVRMARELAIMNQIFSPTHFRWANTQDAPSDYRSFDPKDLETAANQLGQRLGRTYIAKHPALVTAAGDNPAGLDFYVPVLFAEKLELVPPKSGISTLPNARCGGVRVSDLPSPVSGLIVLTEARAPETLAHEMGHYLGLCHTHEQLDRYAVQSTTAVASFASSPACESSGDGICDTPVDPGLENCFRADLCQLQCHAGEHPDASNVMSYYLGCRRALSPDQLTEAARNLQLRRAWFRCQDAHDCPCEPSLRNGCPPEMSCHPSGPADAPFLCELDGNSVPGAPCRSAGNCSARAFCIAGGREGGGRCVRPCENEPGCTCLDVGLRVRVCAEDLQ